MRTNLQACTACVALLAAAPVSAATYPAVELATIAGAVTPTTHPFLLTNTAQATAFVLAAQNDPSKNMQLLRLATSVKAWVANPILISSLETTYSGTDLNTYLNRFSVVTSGQGGAALFALSFAYYHFLYSLNIGFGDSATDAAAAFNARQILYIWAATGFRQNGQVIADYQSFTGTNSDGSEMTPADVWSGVGLQIGRGMLPFVAAEDIMSAGTFSNHEAIIQNFIVSMRDMLIGAANFHYDSSPYYDCHRYDNQAATVMTSLLALGWYTGDGALVNSLAGVPGYTSLEWSWPQQVEAQIYGVGEPARTCNEQTTFYDKYNPITVLGELTDRERNEPYQPFGYPTGSLESLMQAAHMFKDLGWDGYGFTGPDGQSIKVGIDYYAQYYAAYGSLTPASIPDTGTIADFAQYAGDAYVPTGGGEDVMGGDGLVWPYAIANTIYPGDDRIVAALGQAQALYQQELTASFGLVSYLPASKPDILSLMMQGATAN
ncbi:MAG: hypothetical protein ACRYG8_19300 [Janthinobacterium lividum]